jgi:2-polyprenyl-3-methyl-5-hydroxy-6-metoxy-1,4-benzoquinol methylase
LNDAVKMRNSDQNPKSSVTGNAIISPHPNARVYDQSVSISGTIDSTEGRALPRIVQAWIDQTCIGQTRIFGETSPKGQLGYQILAELPEPISEPRSAVIAITLSSENETAAEEIGRVPVMLVPERLRERHYGDVVHPGRAEVLHREDIYGSGPPVEQPSSEALALVLSYLPPKSSIVDVGCGAGAFGPGLIKEGHEWLGLEVNDRCLELLERRKLPHRKLKGTTAQFPCDDCEFDHAICIEVLEHVEDIASFLGEIARIISGRALFSVPNMEVLPLLKDWEVVPWHLLEADHKNFFTRTNLRNLLGRYFSQVEVFSYGEHPLRTRDEIAVHVHLFAVATI